MDKTNASRDGGRAASRQPDTTGRTFAVQAKSGTLSGQTRGKSGPPAWVEPCQFELRRVDPALLAIFNVWWFKLDGGESEPSAAQVRRCLLAEGCKWVPTERPFRTRFNKMKAIVAAYRS